MIDRVHFENFKSLQHVTLELGRLTALVGPNGCGKSSVLHGMHLVSQKARDTSPALELLVRLDPRLMYRGGPGEMKISMRSSSGDDLRVEVREDLNKLPREGIVRPHNSSQEFSHPSTHGEAGHRWPADLATGR